MARELFPLGVDNENESENKREVQIGSIGSEKGVEGSKKLSEPRMT